MKISKKTPKPQFHMSKSSKSTKSQKIINLNVCILNIFTVLLLIIYIDIYECI